MNSHRFDAIARLFAQRRLGRRQLIAQASAGLMGAGLASGDAAHAAAEEGTPASPGDDATTGPQMLFVQSFSSGSIAPSAATEDRYTVTLEHDLGQTIYFSDRPDRVVGAAPTQRFLDGLGFPDDNPPNAAILTDNGDGETTLAVVELFSPTYDAERATVTYEVAVLDHWQNATDLGFAETPVDLGAMGTAFGTTHLFIDDCPTRDITCISLTKQRAIGTISASSFGGYCFSPLDAACLPCTPWHDSISSSAGYWESVCADQFPECEGGCSASGAYWLDPDSD